MTTEENYIEISDSGDFIRIQPKAYSIHESEHNWDKNWLRTNILVQAGVFSGDYVAEVMTIDFKNLRRQIAILYNNPNGNAKFADIEGYIQLEFEGDGLGHFEVGIAVKDQPTQGAQLTFKLNFDQTQIPSYLSQLDKIMQMFPVVGEIRN